MNSRSFLHATLAILGWLALAAAPVAIQANNTWGNYHWARSSNPVILQLGDNVSSDWDAYLVQASADWNGSTVLFTSIVAGGANPKNCRPGGGEIQVCSDTYGNNGWLGLAQIWVSGGHIDKGAVKVNDTYYYAGGPYDTYSWRSIVMCQEVGHIFGLSHQDENFNNPNLGSCMDYTSNPNGNEHPNAHDYATLEDIYAHLDSSEGGGGGPPPWARGGATRPPALDVLDLEGPGQWGELISGSREGGASTYVLDFGGGHAVITFVTWVLE